MLTSAGVSYSKFLAKLTSDQRKPDGHFGHHAGMGPAWVETLPVARFYGSGRAPWQRWRGSAFTGADLRAQTLTFIATHFGKLSGSETTSDRDLVQAIAIEAGVLRMSHGNP